MAIIYTQTDAVTDCGGVQACASGTVSGTTLESELIDGGTAGSTEQSTAIPAGTSRLVAFMQTSGGVGESTWDSGTYTVRFNVTTSQMDTSITGIWICRLNSSCTNQATVGSDTSLSTSISGGGVFTFNISGTEQSATDTDDLYIIAEIANSHSMADRTVGITPDQDVDTPITSGAKSTAQTETVGIEEGSGNVAGKVIGGTSAIVGEATTGLFQSQVITEVGAAVDSMTPRGWTFASPFTTKTTTTTPEETSTGILSKTVTKLGGIESQLLTETSAVIESLTKQPSVPEVEVATAVGQRTLAPTHRNIETGVVKTTRTNAPSKLFQPVAAAFETLTNTPHLFKSTARSETATAIETTVNSPRIFVGETAAFFESRIVGPSSSRTATVTVLGDRSVGVTKPVSALAVAIESQAATIIGGLETQALTEELAAIEARVLGPVLPVTEPAVAVTSRTVQPALQKTATSAGFETFTRTFDGLRSLPETVASIGRTNLGPDVLFIETTAAIDATVDPLFDGIRSFVETSVGVETFSITSAVQRQMAEVVSAVETFTRAFDGTRFLSESAAAFETFTRVFDGIRQPSETVATIGRTTFDPELLLLSTVSALETTVDPLFDGTRMFTATVVGEESLSASELAAEAAQLVETLVVDETFTRTADLLRAFTPVAAVVETRSVMPSVVLSPLVAIEETVAPVLAAARSLPLTPVIDERREVAPGLVQTAQTATVETFARTVDAIRDFSALAVGIENLSSSKLAAQVANLAETVVGVETFGRTITASRLFSPVVAVVETPRLVPAVALSGVVATTETFRRVIDAARNFSPTVSVIEQTNFGPDLLFFSTATAVETTLDPVATLVRGFTETTVSFDTISTSKLAAQAAALVETVAITSAPTTVFDGIRSFTQTAIVDETAAPSARFVSAVGETAAIVTNRSQSVLRALTATAVTTDVVSTVHDAVRQFSEVDVVDGTVTTATDLVTVFSEAVATFDTRVLGPVRRISVTSALTESRVVDVVLTRVADVVAVDRDSVKKLAEEAKLLAETTAVVGRRTFDVFHVNRESITGLPVRSSVVTRPLTSTVSMVGTIGTDVVELVDTVLLDGLFNTDVAVEGIFDTSTALDALWVIEESLNAVFDTDETASAEFDTDETLEGNVNERENE